MNPDDKPDFRSDLTKLLNVYGKDSDAKTPDFVLANFMINCLEAYTNAKRYSDYHYPNN